jgi:hypothetical protein
MFVCVVLEMLYIGVRCVRGAVYLCALCLVHAWEKGGGVDAAQ